VISGGDDDDDGCTEWSTLDIRQKGMTDSRDLNEGEGIFFGKLHCELIYVKDVEEIVIGGILRGILVFRFITIFFFIILNILFFIFSIQY